MNEDVAVHQLQPLAAWMRRHWPAAGQDSIPARIRHHGGASAREFHSRDHRAVSGDLGRRRRLIFRGREIMGYKGIALSTCMLCVVAGAASSDGIVGSVVSSPLSSDGTVIGSRTGMNIYLEKPEAAGIEFMNPEFVGYGVPPGGRLEVELVSGFERDPAVPLEQPSIMLVTGAPQQGMPGDAIGYSVGQGETENTFEISPNSDSGLVSEEIMSPAPGAQGDPVRQRGLKVIHVGLKKAFINRGESGEVSVRIYDGNGKIAHEGSGRIDFLDAPVPQIFPNNFAHGRRDHNWQNAAPGEIVGQAEGTVPITLMLYERNQPGGKAGIVGAGVVSTQQLAAMEFELPAELARYTGGLIVQDVDGDGVAEPGADRIIGGVIGSAPEGAKGQELRSLVRDGAADLSRPTAAFARGPGRAMGGAIMQLEFAAGDMPGLYRPTLALLRDPGDTSSGDGSSYTYTIVVE